MCVTERSHTLWVVSDPTSAAGRIRLTVLLATVAYLYLLLLSTTTNTYIIINKNNNKQHTITKNNNSSSSSNSSSSAVRNALAARRPTLEESWCTPAQDRSRLYFCIPVPWLHRLAEHSDYLSEVVKHPADDQV